MEEGKATIVPLGDAAMLVRFGSELSDAANRRAVAFAAELAEAPPAGVLEIVPSLVSVQLRLAPGVEFRRLAGEIGLRLTRHATLPSLPSAEVAVEYDGADIEEVAALCRLSVAEFVTAHLASTPRVLAVGFAPGFVYCGFHDEGLLVPRRQQVRASVPAGTILFAAGQTAITSTPIRTGWHVIGRTAFRNFDPGVVPPVKLRPGTPIRFVSP